MSLHAIPAMEGEFSKPTLTNLGVEAWHDLACPEVMAPVQGWRCLPANQFASSIRRSNGRPGSLAPWSRGYTR